MVGLGCETNQIDGLLEQEGLHRSPHCRPSASRTPAARRRRCQGHRAGRSGCWKRPTACSASRCRPATSPSGLQCGGSDGYSGISANPALGAAVRSPGPPRRHGDPQRIARGLRRRAPADAPRGEQAVADKLVARLRWWEDYTARATAARWTTTLGGQQGRRPDHHPGEEPGRGRQERHHQPGRGSGTRRR